MSTTAYEHTTETHSGPAPIRPHPEYVKSTPGLLKIAEIILSVLVLICASIDWWYSIGGGWVQFVAASALITTVILFIFHFFNLISRVTVRWNFIEFIYYCVFVVLYVIAAIVAAVRAHLAPSIVATAIFTFLALAVYAIDTYLMYKAWQTIQHPSTGGAAVTTTTTTTTYETRTQY
ncbi:CKLF-like MARVEL transmembrane domain-containing protein 4 [Biomphalaria pfeifferi]|uniref:CKLF-like MARVEL transmembrane domain-containing protein 4 n=1 Tax=Biomphalaria pfeifferi TaxID=112525 RepID=A0AAD8BW10_BIOPF|nr:CKLF-like MARVEL transmembrane domain-containing protein 4 [Biomphalaria pfeifferi]